MRAWIALLLLLSAGLAGCSREEGIDSDGDGLLDEEERRLWTITVDLLGRRISYQVSPDPMNPDTDGDGLGDAFELQLLPPLDPTKADTDGDGLSDCQEALHSVLEECESNTWVGETDGGTGTDPANADSDAGFSRYITNHLNFVDETGTLSLPVPWGDGIPDGQELAGYNITLPNGAKRFVQTDPRNGDSDRDGLEDGEELFVYRTDPTVANTDGDVCEDGRDPMPGYAERYVLGLEDITLSNSFAHSQIDILWQVNIVENAFFWPQDGRQTIQRGENDLSARNPPPQAWAQCSATPNDPWTRIQLQPYYEDSDGVHVLDINSINVPTGLDGTTPSVWLHVPTGNLAWSTGGEALPAPLEWRGEDGVLTWRPHTV